MAPVIDLGFSVSDVVTNMQPILTTLGPILAFACGIPVAFYLASKVKRLFASSNH